MSEQIKDGGAVDVLEELAHWCNENGIGRDKYARRSATYAAVAELIRSADIVATALSNLIAAGRVDARYGSYVTELTTALNNVGPQ